MEIINLLDNATNQQSKKRTKDLLKTNGYARKTHNKNNLSKSETAMFQLRLCDNRNSYILITEP